MHLARLEKSTPSISCEGIIILITFCSAPWPRQGPRRSPEPPAIMHSARTARQAAIGLKSFHVLFWGIQMLASMQY